ncbi:hypothetical protein MNBD_BACTEROID06-465 [hydrothermal vent metagenome]|uniref:Uncharacterized protein n=1 Tax=hydrothermal vent metagenome TaxID=652676 RepID=A0A3B0UJJ6_9ZZZZ
MILKDTNELKELLISEFQRNLLQASLDNINNSSNKLRFNNFAYSMRELSRHLLHSLSSDQDVLDCSWYENETSKPNGISRGQRIKYAIQGGLEDSFVDSELVEITTINAIKKKLKGSIDLLSKYTHVNPNTFDIPDMEMIRLSEEVMKHLIEFAKTIIESRQMIISEIEEKINDEFIQHSINETIDEVDILATHHNTEEISVDHTGISKILSDRILIDVEGFVRVRLQWGSNSDLKNDNGAEMYDSFPYNGTVEVKLNGSFEYAEVSIANFDVNTDSWYE